MTNTTLTLWSLVCADLIIKMVLKPDFTVNLLHSLSFNKLQQSGLDLSLIGLCVNKFHYSFKE